MFQTKFSSYIVKKGILVRSVGYGNASQNPLSHEKKSLQISGKADVQVIYKSKKQVASKSSTAISASSAKI